MPSMQQSLQPEFVKQYSVKNRHSLFCYVFGDEPINDLGGAEEHSKTANTASAISKFDTWFCSLTPFFYNIQQKLPLQLLLTKCLLWILLSLHLSEFAIFSSMTME